MRSEADWDQLIEGLRAGDERAAEAFCAEFGGPLERVAERNIAPHLRRRFGPESVAQSACCSFLRRAREGSYELEDAEALWRLMSAITLRKVREKVRFHSRRRRDHGREAAMQDGRDEPSAPQPGPEEAAAIAEEFERLFAGLTDEERTIVELKLDRRGADEIAAALGCSERTVRRLAQELRARLEAALDVERDG